MKWTGFKLLNETVAARNNTKPSCPVSSEGLQRWRRNSINIYEKINFYNVFSWSHPQEGEYFSRWSVWPWHRPSPVASFQGQDAVNRMTSKISRWGCLSKYSGRRYNKLKLPTIHWLLEHKKNRLREEKLKSYLKILHIKFGVICLIFRHNLYYILRLFKSKRYDKI